MGLKIVVIEDNDTEKDLLLKALCGMEKYAVKERDILAFSGLEPIARITAAIQEFKPSLILCDVFIGADARRGVDIMELLHKNSKPIQYPFIYLSAMSHKGLQELWQGEVQPFDTIYKGDFFGYDFDPKLISNKIELILERYFSSNKIISILSYPAQIKIDIKTEDILFFRHNTLGTEIMLKKSYHYYFEVQKPHVQYTLIADVKFNFFYKKTNLYLI
ncbi:response regulator [Hugenholtzia roseola]|uniref:response regulator n=1 Tax=Hugenholtzia roseola TaxID=1002 RepID=UPI00047EBD09|nr:response regulator [Hugenholtzia roseola]